MIPGDLPLDEPESPFAGERCTVCGWDTCPDPEACAIFFHVLALDCEHPSLDVSGPRVCCSRCHATLENAPAELDS